MLETKHQGRSVRAINPDTHAECLEFIRVAISASDREFAEQIAKILKDVCQNRHADRAASWSELSLIEQQQFRTLLAPPPVAREFAKTGLILFF